MRVPVYTALVLSMLMLMAPYGARESRVEGTRNLEYVLRCGEYFRGSFLPNAALCSAYPEYQRLPEYQRIPDYLPEHEPTFHVRSTYTPHDPAAPQPRSPQVVLILRAYVPTYLLPTGPNAAILDIHIQSTYALTMTVTALDTEYQAAPRLIYELIGIPSVHPFGYSFIYSFIRIFRYARTNVQTYKRTYKDSRF